MNFRAYHIDKNKVLWRKIGEETVILDIGSGFYYTLDGIGSLIWDMIVNKQLEDQIAKAIIDGYEVSRPQAEKDIRNVLRDLQREKLIQIL